MWRFILPLTSSYPNHLVVLRGTGITAKNNARSFRTSSIIKSFYYIKLWHCGVVVIITAQLYLTVP